MESDADLMMRAQQGDRDAFSILVQKHQNALVNFFYRMTWNRQDAEDFAQDVFVKVYLARASYKIRSKFTTYLFRIATNYWIDYLRTKGKRKKPVSLDKEFDSADNSENLKHIIPSNDLSPEEEALRKEQMQRARNAIDSLPEEQKVVFLLSETQGMKYQEIADTLNLPLGTVKSRIHAAVLKLRVAFTAKGII